VNSLDGLLLTHGDAQHVGGASTVLAELDPQAFFETPVRDRSPTRRSFHTQLEQRAFGKSIVWRGDRIALGGDATLRVLYPPAGLAGVVADDKALVVQLTSASVQVLFMSDSGFTTEQWLMENESDLRCDVLVKGWHSKDLSGTPDFLARVQPQAVICSSLEYGDTGSALDRWSRDLAARGITIFRQDRCGAVRIEIRNGIATLRAVATDQTFRSRAR
jgi:competence protein ComEC